MYIGIMADILRKAIYTYYAWTNLAKINEMTTSSWVKG
jgi:hypothetical protein